MDESGKEATEPSDESVPSDESTPSDESVPSEKSASSNESRPADGTFVEPALETKRADRGPHVPLLTLVLAVAIGALAGIGGYTFRYAEGLSYFKTDPRACVNCHIMQPEYDAWQKSSHHTVAVCVDCHLPHSFVPKYLAKAENGWRHGKMFTTQNFEEPITVKERGLEILQENCQRCHGALTAELLTRDDPPGRAHPEIGGLACIHCHFTVGHGVRAGLGGPLRPSETDVPSPEALR